MKKISMLFASSALVALSAASLAQEEAPEMYTYASYYTCDGGPLSAADESMAEAEEFFNGLVDNGTLARWGYLGHHTGGNWMRILYFQAESLDALLDGSAAMLAGPAPDDEESADDAEAADDADEADDGPGFGAVCTRHDDYIWQVENGSSGETRGAAGFSVYHVCDSSREERADEIVAEHVAPIMNGLIEDGSLTSWGWSSHVVGGKYRRLQTMTGADHKSVLKARAAAIGAIYADDNEMGAELNDICGSHVDYMWDIIMEK